MHAHEPIPEKDSVETHYEFVETPEGKERLDLPAQPEVESEKKKGEGVPENPERP